MRHSVVRFVLPTLGLALLAAFLAQYIGLPLPWMIGPLFAVAGARMCDLPLQPLAGGRQAGQWAIGTALGLYFSPAVLGQLAEHALLLAAAALASLALGGVCALLTLRLARVDAATAFFASLPGGASEMANLAERWGGAVDRIAAAHALRIMLLVVAGPGRADAFRRARQRHLHSPVAQLRPGPPAATDRRQPGRSRRIAPAAHRQRLGARAAARGRGAQRPWPFPCPPCRAGRSTAGSC